MANLCSRLGPKHGVQCRMIFSGQFFCIFEIIIFCFVVAICDLVRDVENIFHLSYVLTASGNLFLQIVVSWASLIFQKDFQMLLTFHECHALGQIQQQNNKK